ncbi:MAG: hypothetical protein Q8K07_04085 [Methylicorpusculum sp.]|uniref:hypothetical protein n=1 Tax=Methylicorpusculum sp. TaxID=2713644 RepID=UPI002731659E|nr:hypothetical protein [Methylicorpusculum sp.]MDP2201173.1 hypothetical protein [Methylicorpusculum sp.]
MTVILWNKSKNSMQLPLLLSLRGEKVSSAIDNHNRAERLGFINSTDDWMAKP